MFNIPLPFLRSQFWSKQRQFDHLSSFKLCVQFLSKIFAKCQKTSKAQASVLIHSETDQRRDFHYFFGAAFNSLLSCCFCTDVKLQRGATSPERSIIDNLFSRRFVRLQWSLVVCASSSFPSLELHQNVSFSFQSVSICFTFIHVLTRVAQLGASDISHHSWRENFRLILGIFVIFFFPYWLDIELTLTASNFLLHKKLHLSSDYFHRFALYDASFTSATFCFVKFDFIASKIHQSWASIMSVAHVTACSRRLNETFKLLSFQLSPLSLSLWPHHEFKQNSIRSMFDHNRRFVLLSLSFVCLCCWQHHLKAALVHGKPSQMFFWFSPSKCATQIIK